MEDLHNQYLDLQIPSAPQDLAWVETQLKAVAIDAVQWWTEFTRSQSPEDQEQYGCRKHRTKVSGSVTADDDWRKRELINTH
ncbi:hypothetical protein QM012_009588 [Aureobasidium pullulans]|uniref:Uncharacterized protein n=1 Tax=Aureobasidium pullulans TaxID=5580 RepID=A0ABR0TI66_AURPU